MVRDDLFLLQSRECGHSSAFVISLALHVSLGFLLLWFDSSARNSPAERAVAWSQDTHSQIVWIAQPGPEGGGGGGGNRMSEPPRQVKLPGQDPHTVPVAPPLVLDVIERPKVDPNPVAQLDIPALTLASATESLVGVLEAVPAASTASQGRGGDTGAGDGRGGPGIGDGAGPGLGPGREGNRGGRPRTGGGGATGPRLIRQVPPQYTSEAVRARIQGVALVRCIVRTTGTPTDCQISRSLDSAFGLDQEALRAARQWQFMPGTLGGERVNVPVIIEMTFTLR
jgi:periplasmic protein TonB